MKRIAFIGAQGTGKSSLAHETVYRLKTNNIDTEFLGEVARQCPFPINEETTRKGQEWIIYNQYLQELEMSQRCDLLICDRSVLDGYVYYRQQFSKDPLLEIFVKEKLKGYDLLVKVPIREGFLKDDGIRTTNKKFQEQIDNQFEKQLRHFKTDFYRHKTTKATLDKIIKTIS